MIVVYKNTRWDAGVDNSHRVAKEKSGLLELQLRNSKRAVIIKDRGRIEYQAFNWTIGTIAIGYEREKIDGHTQLRSSKHSIDKVFESCPGAALIYCSILHDAIHARYGAMLEALAAPKVALHACTVCHASQVVLRDFQGSFASHGPRRSEH